MVGVLTACGGGPKDLKQIDNNAAMTQAQAIVAKQESGDLSITGNVIAGELTTYSKTTSGSTTSEANTTAEFGFDADNLFYYSILEYDTEDVYQYDENYMYFKDGKMYNGNKSKETKDGEVVEHLATRDMTEDEAKAFFEEGKSGVLSQLDHYVYGETYIYIVTSFIAQAEVDGVELYYGSDDEGSFQGKIKVDATVTVESITTSMKGSLNVIWKNYLLNYVDIDFTSTRGEDTQIMKASGEVTDSFKISYPTWKN